MWLMRKRWLLVVAALPVLAAAGLTAAAYAVDRSRSDQLAEGVTVAGIEVGGMDVDVARRVLQRRIVRRLERPVVVRHGRRSFRLSAADAGVHVDLDGMLEAALERSRDGHFLTRVYREATGGHVDVRVRLRVSTSHRAVVAFVDRIARQIDRPAKSATLVPYVSYLATTPSRNGVAVPRRALVHAVEDRLVRTRARRVLRLPTRVVRPETSTADLPKKYPVYLTVDRGAKVLRLFERLRLARTYPIAVGQAGLETPAGLYTIDDKQVNPSWHVPNSPWAGALAGRVIPPGPDDPIKARWLGIYNGAGIHGTEDVSSLGTAASHGCIRMSIPDVVELYDRVPFGTPVYIT
jgi:lipoprotein-anchoring transpeptidase ErfK/SrfK